MPENSSENELQLENCSRKKLTNAGYDAKLYVNCIVKQTNKKVMNYVRTQQMG